MAAGRLGGGVLLLASLIVPGVEAQVGEVGKKNINNEGKKRGRGLLVSRKLAGNGEKASFVEAGVRRSGGSFIHYAENISSARVNISYRASSKHIKAGVP